jgi:hypothetical protein
MSYDGRPPRGSSRGITVEQYVSTLPYEMMPFDEKLFTSLVNNESMTEIFGVPISTKSITTELEQYRKKFNKLKNKDITQNKILSNDIKREIFYYLLQYRLFELYYDTQQIDLAKTKVTDDEHPVTGKSARTKQKQDLNDEINKLLSKENKSIADIAKIKMQKDKLTALEDVELLAKNRILYILPTIDSAQPEYIKSSLNPKIDNEDKNYYNKLLSSKNNSTYDNIFLLPVFTTRPDTLEEFKSRIDQSLKNLSEKIIDKGKRDETAYTQIIYYVDNEKDKFFYTGFFKNSLKNDYVTELNSKLKNFFISRVGNQQLTLNYKPYFSDIASLKSINIEKNIASTFDNSMRESLQQLIECIKNCYLSFTDINIRKSLSENVNINTFHIYSRLENLDDSDPMGTVVAAKDYCYLFLEQGKNPKLGHLEVSNISKNQYFFVVDKTGIFEKWASAVYIYDRSEENFPYKKDPGFKYRVDFDDNEKKATLIQTHKIIMKNGKKIINKIDDNMVIFYTDGQVIKFDKDNQMTWSEDYIKYKTKYNPSSKKTSIDDEDIPETKSLIEQESDKDHKRVLIQVRYNYGQIQFKNIQERMNSPFTGVLKFQTIDREYEKYNWFVFNTIDRALEPKMAINYYEDTMFDKDSLRAYLKSENKLTDKTRIAFEFLKMNYNIPELKKYSDFIYDNFKQNINLNLNDKTFVEKIKRGIIDIVFEKNGLIYVKKSNIIAEKEKEKPDADNYKIINCKYVSIRNKNVEPEIKNYFNKNDFEESKYLKNKFKNMKEVKTMLNMQEKKTGGFAIIQITRDIIGDSTNLYLAAECKKRSRRIKSKFKQAMNFVLQGGKSKKRKNKNKTKKYYRT